MLAVMQRADSSSCSFVQWSFGQARSPSDLCSSLKCSPRAPTQIGARATYSASERFLRMMILLNADCGLDRHLFSIRIPQSEILKAFAVERRIEHGPQIGRRL